MDQYYDTIILNRSNKRGADDNTESSVTMNGSENTCFWQ